MAGQNSASPNIDDLTPEEASRIIHSHRKVRYGMLLIYFVFLFVSSPILPLYLLHLWSFIVFLFLSLVSLYPLRASILLFFFFSEASSFPLVLFFFMLVYRRVLPVMLHVSVAGPVPVPTPASISTGRGLRAGQTLIPKHLSQPLNILIGRLLQHTIAYYVHTCRVTQTHSR